MNSEHVPSVRQEIENGPSKWDLMLALFDRKSPAPRAVHFALAGKEYVTVIIDGVCAVDDSDSSWSFTGHIVGWFFNDQSRMSEMMRRRHPEGHLVSGSYRSDDRKGHVLLPV